MGKPHERLRGQMHHDVGPGLANGRGQPGRIANIGLMVHIHQIANPGDVEERGIRRRSQRIACHLRPEPMQEHHEPGALEARVARDEDPLAPKAVDDGHHHTFQAASPSFHISLT